MKAALISIVLGAFLNAGCITNVEENDAVSTANAINKIKAANGVFNYDVAEFLVTCADIYIMGISDGKLATQRGTTKTIKEYGQLIAMDHQLLLKKIEAIANIKQVTLPPAKTVKLVGRTELINKYGKDFDDMFLKIMYAEHHRNMKLFEKVTMLKDKEISNFANRYRPVVNSLFYKIQIVRNSQNQY